ncbi:adenosylmethionine--8-amino-7-oxononanoate transaminase [Desulfonatronovibrio magnus]|uniref:adenosylmethionine--8-amino-7-oxononanoate transaminase n=1 Tax=Desulfonatronovibrio magnus TaxID=698827 RepID=UPI0005EB0AD3|nr:adenosylmethionine--8-amino-7-oxononanoate transaminase [Desulfonatronovibrio magnus]
MNWTQMLDFDRGHIWHPYTSLASPLPVYPVESASGVRVRLQDGTELVDGMASWWCVIHGYNHPVLNEAVQKQLHKMAHVMFGGFTHEPAVELAQMLRDLTPQGLEKVFFCDSGSVSVEVALKMALQYWHAAGKPEKTKFISLERGYHGDTFGAMSVCDPVTGMHTLFSGFLPRNFFAPSPGCGFAEPCLPEHLEKAADLIKQHHREVAAFILEPVVQGAGGMKFYSPEYLNAVKQLCRQYDLLLIADEIATGFGRTGRLFACEHAGITPDIMCVGKALTGGYMSLAAAMCTDRIAEVISSRSPGAFMHGPTFMGNPLACATAVASIQLLLDCDWQKKIMFIEQELRKGLESCIDLPGVREVRVLGAIGVLEMEDMVDTALAQKMFVELGVWIRPFLNLIYVMPPYVADREDVAKLTQAMRYAAENI